MSEFTIPEGYQLLDRNSAFSDLTGPYYEKRVNGVHQSLAMLLEEKHTNKLGVAHGGALMTLADNAFGDALISIHNEPVSFVTVSMSSEFLDPARPGDWVEANVTVLRQGRRMVFVDCILTVGDKKVFHASGVMAIVRPR